MQSEFFFWLSIFTVLLSLALIFWDIYLLALKNREKENHKSQVKIWQNFANGIFQGLQNISSAADESKFSTPKDTQQAVDAIKPIAYSLYNSLFEERLFSEKEIKERQLRQEDEFKKLLSQKTQTG